MIVYLPLTSTSSLILLNRCQSSLFFSWHLLVPKVRGGGGCKFPTHFLLLPLTPSNQYHFTLLLFFLDPRIPGSFWHKIFPDSQVITVYDNFSEYFTSSFWNSVFPITEITCNKSTHHIVFVWPTQLLSQLPSLSLLSLKKYSQFSCFRYLLIESSYTPDSWNKEKKIPLLIPHEFTILYLRSSPLYVASSVPFY